MPSKRTLTHTEEYTKFSNIVNLGIKKIQNEIINSVPGFEIELDILFNAFTESEYGTHLKKNDNFAFSKVYVDSGGLQIVTLGKPIDDTIKKQIYTTQAVADYAMCFDEIPTISTKKGTAGRASTTDKMYIPSRAKSCAIKTAHNIKEQCEVISNINDTTSVFYIVQGNNENDMYDWFKNGNSVIKDYSKIGGLALADTCMGNGTLETIEMLAAYNRIFSDYGVDITKKHIHLLGVGSVSRLLPIFYTNGSMLPEDITISFDSTSFSMTYIMGKFMDKNGKNVENNQLEKYFNEIVNMFEDIILGECLEFDKSKFISHLKTHIMSSADTINKADQWYVAQAIVTLSCVYQMYGFITRLKKELELIETSNSPLAKLKSVYNYKDFQKWMRDYSRYVDSSRIKREPDFVLDEFFN
jgi:hypothetical protein